jgi:hypothetical protein
MKLRAILMAAAIATTFLASTRVASAQQQVVATIPFAFAAGAANLPAGDYNVKVTEANGMLRLTNLDNPKISAFVPANPAVSSGIQDQSKLIFNRYGDRYFLSQVWTAGNSTGKQLLKTAREKESAMIAKADTSQVVLVASLSTTPR